MFSINYRADDGIRTCDLRVTSALLYQLSYVGLIVIFQVVVTTNINKKLFIHNENKHS